MSESEYYSDTESFSDCHEDHCDCAHDWLNSSDSEHVPVATDSELSHSHSQHEVEGSEEVASDTEPDVPGGGRMHLPLGYPRAYSTPDSDTEGEQSISSFRLESTVRVGHFTGYMQASERDESGYLADVCETEDDSEADGDDPLSALHGEVVNAVLRERGLYSRDMVEDINADVRVIRARIRRAMVTGIGRPLPTSQRMRGRSFAMRRRVVTP